MELHELPTPSFVVDLAVLERNIAFMKSRARALGVNLRPHTKTHKTREIALRQVDATRSITVSTLAEAEFFLEAGIRDIIYAVPIHPGRLDRVSRLISAGADLKILVDHPSVLNMLELKAAEKRTAFKIMLKIDSGYGRAGLPPGSDTLYDMALRIHRSGNLGLAGVLTHAGHSYQCTDASGIRAVAEEERLSVVRSAERLRMAGVPCPMVSVGSSPTAVHAENLAGVTEMRPGCYAFFDKFQSDIGTCSPDDCAVSVLAGIIGIYPERNRILVDAGALALSKDPGAVHLQQEKTYGTVKGRPDLYVASISQEHGQITSSRPLDFNAFRIGGKVSIIPNHCCLAAALFPEYQVVEGGLVKETWKPVRGW